MQEATLAMIVVDRKVPGRAVVPEGERAFAPMEAAGKLGPHRMPVEVFEQRARFLVGPAVEAQGETRVDIERLAAGLRVADDGGVDGVLCRKLRVADAALEVAASGVGFGAEDVPARMQGSQAVEGRL